MLLAPKVTFSETTVPLSLEREESVIRSLWNKTTPRWFYKELLKAIRIRCFHKGKLCKHWQHCWALKITQINTACLLSDPPLLTFLELWDVSTAPAWNTIYPTREQKSGKILSETNLWIYSVTGARAASISVQAPSSSTRASLAGIASAIPYPTRGLSLPTVQHGQSQRDKLGVTFSVLSGAKFTHPRGILQVPGSAPTPLPGAHGMWWVKRVCNFVKGVVCQGDGLWELHITLTWSNDPSWQRQHKAAAQRVWRHFSTYCFVPQHKGTQKFSPPSHLKPNQTLIHPLLGQK